jgi:hypothetical protein
MRAKKNRSWEMRKEREDDMPALQLKVIKTTWTKKKSIPNPSRNTQKEN